MRWMLCAVLVATAGCADDGSAGADATTGNDGAVGADAPVAVADASTRVTDFAVAGPFAVTTTTDSLTTGGCALDYTLYTPGGDTTAPLVILGHGFARSQTNMANLAEHIASFGMRVATPDYCHLSPTDTDHSQNGVDSAALSASLAAGADVAHAGQSAGGLAAVLAASQDPSATAVLGLDLVDNNDLGANAAATLTSPLFGMVGEPSSCNSNNNGLPLFTSQDAWGVRVNGATHCDFEDPTDGLCTSFCGGSSGAIAVIRAVAAGYLAWQLGVDASGEQWATPAGSEWQRLVGEGDLSSL